MGGYGLVFVVAAAATFLLTFVVRRLSIRFGAVVRPDERRLHALPTPTAGGAAMFLAFLLAMVVASRIPQFENIFRGSSEPLGIVLGAALIFGVGLLDDVREVSAPAKLAGQVLAGSVMSLLGVAMFYFRVPFTDFIVLSPDMQPLLTVLWVAGMANAINLIDGLDGLAAGIVGIAAGAFFLYGDRLFEAGLLDPGNAGPLVAIIAAGVCVGFLPHNFHPARIFMGDAGSLFLGLLMASSTMLVGGRTADYSGQTYFFFAPVVIPFVILGVPIFDTLFAIVRRSRKGGVFVADKGHLHHRLMHLGHGQRRSVVILWAWTAILSALVLFPTYTNRGNAILPLLMVGLAVLLYTLFHPSTRRVNGEGTRLIDLVVGDAASANGDVRAEASVPPKTS